MQTAAYENQRADGPNAGDRAKPSTAAINQATPPPINKSKVTRKKYPGCVARSCCSNIRSRKNICLEFLLRGLVVQTNQAPSAHVSRFGLCTNGVENLVGFECKSLHGKSAW